jgi:hypothetical protein
MMQVGGGGQVFWSNTSSSFTTACQPSGNEDICYMHYTRTGATSDYIVIHDAVPTDWTSGTLSLKLSIDCAGTLSPNTYTFEVTTGYYTTSGITYNGTPQSFGSTSCSTANSFVTLSGVTTTGFSAGAAVAYKIQRTDTNGDLYWFQTDRNYAIP